MDQDPQKLTIPGLPLLPNKLFKGKGKLIHPQRPKLKKGKGIINTLMSNIRKTYGTSKKNNI